MRMEFNSPLIPPTPVKMKRSVTKSGAGLRNLSQGQKNNPQQLELFSSSPSTSSSSSSSLSNSIKTPKAINPKAVEINGKFYEVALKGIGGFKNTYFFAESDGDKTIAIKGQEHRLDSLVLKTADFKNKNLISLQGIDPKYNWHNARTLLEQEREYDNLLTRGVPVAAIYLRAAESSTGSFVLAEKMAYETPIRNWIGNRASATFEELDPISQTFLLFARERLTLALNAIQQRLTLSGHLRDEQCNENREYIDDLRPENVMGKQDQQGTFIVKVIDPSDPRNNGNAEMTTLAIVHEYLKRWSGFQQKGFNGINKNIFNWLISDINPEILVQLAEFEDNLISFNPTFFAIVAKKLASSGHHLEDSFRAKYARHIIAAHLESRLKQRAVTQE
jgi:hypothetical protein